jgi:hypothetical protein
MAEDWAVDVKKYASDADEKAIAGIEVARVRDNFLKKKLGLNSPDSELDQAILAVAAKMKGDRTKNRVTVYYLLAEHFGKLSTFI